MSDYAHKETDKMLEKIEGRLTKEYATAYSESRAKLDRYLERFEDADAKMQKNLADGKITQRQYKKWRKSKIATGRRYSALVDVLARDLNNANVIAMGIVRGELSGVFALNANYEHYSIEQDVGMELGFTLYDRETVARLVRDNPSLLPDPSPDIARDVLWNRQHIRSAILQGVLQGEPIGEISKRLETVVGMDRAAAVRNARTAMTGAQNAGRQQAYYHAQEMGLQLKKMWVATKDGRTRHEHGAADGQTVGLTDPFIIGGYKMHYPGEPSAPGHLVYNCRCTTRTVEVPGIEAETRKMRTAGDENPVDYITFPEWAKIKGIKGW